MAKVAAAVKGDEKKPRARKAKSKNDPRLVAAARELRDRWLEHVNVDGGADLVSDGKYDLTRGVAGVRGCGVDLG